MKHFDKLYNYHIKKSENIEKKSEELRKESIERKMKDCTFKPEINHYLKEVVFENKMDENEIRIYEQTVERMRNGILQTFKKKYLADR